MKLHHVGIACYDIESTAQFYISQGYIKTPTVYDAIQNVNICFLCKSGDGCVELISPKDGTSPICKILQKNGVSPYHICYETSNLDKTVLELKVNKFLLVSKPAPAVALGNRRVCFLFNKNIGLIELVETEDCQI